MVGILLYFLTLFVVCAIRAGLCFGLGWLFKFVWKASQVSRVRTAVAILLTFEAIATVVFLSNGSIPIDQMRPYIMGTILAGIIYITVWNGVKEDAERDAKQADEEVSETFE